MTATLYVHDNSGNTFCYILLLHKRSVPTWYTLIYERGDAIIVISIEILVNQYFRVFIRIKTNHIIILYYAD